MLDVFSRRIVGWSMAHHLRTELVLHALNMALTRRRSHGVVHHSDKGTQYTSPAFGTRCREMGVVPSAPGLGVRRRLPNRRASSMHWIAGTSRLSIPLSSISPDSRRRSSSPSSSSDTAPGIFVRSVTRPSRCRTCTASCRSSDPNTRLPCFAPSPQRSRITATTRILPLATCLPIELGGSSRRCLERSRRPGNRARPRHLFSRRSSQRLL